LNLINELQRVSLCSWEKVEGQSCSCNREEEKTKRWEVRKRVSGGMVWF